MAYGAFPKRKKIYIAPSPIHGYGIFAARNLKKGEIVYRVTGKSVRWIVKDKETAQVGQDWFGIGKNIWRDPGNDVPKYQNHSSNPSCGIKGTVTVCALRDIKKGEEITIDYSITEAETLWTMQDTSVKGHPKTVRSIQFLPLKKFERYLPYIPRYFQNVYYKYHHLKRHA